MHYDQSWMGYGWVGGLEAGLIAAVAGALLYPLFRWLLRGRPHGLVPALVWAYLVALLLTASGDLWDMFYFNFGRLQSLQLLKAELAEVHDPDSIGTRALCELLGAAAGAGLAAWLLPGGRRRAAS